MTDSKFLQKKTQLPILALLLINCGLAYFFATYWLSNPDQFPTNGVNSYDCYAN